MLTTDTRAGEQSGDERAIAPLLAALGETAFRHPVPELREALPVLRGLTPRAVLCRETMRRIEKATVGSRHLPIPAAAP